MFKNDKSKKGFTLIELLVTISIISLLSSVILVTVNNAKSKARDAVVKQEFDQLGSLMALNYNDYGSYTNLQKGGIWITAENNCDTVYGGPTFLGTYATQASAICKKIFNNAYPNSDYRFAFGGVTDNVQSYSFMVLLNNGNWYCMGSSGTKAEYFLSYMDAFNDKPGCMMHP